MYFESCLTISEKVGIQSSIPPTAYAFIKLDKLDPNEVGIILDILVSDFSCLADDYPDAYKDIYDMPLASTSRALPGPNARVRKRSASSARRALSTATPSHLPGSRSAPRSTSSSTPPASPGPQSTPSLSPMPGRRRRFAPSCGSVLSTGLSFTMLPWLRPTQSRVSSV